MEDKRSRSPAPGVVTPQEPAQTLGQREQEQFQQELQALRSIVERQDGRLNTIDQRSAHTRDQVQKAQQLEASRQATDSSWPDSAGPQDRSQAVEYMENRHEALKGSVCQHNDPPQQIWVEPV